MISGRHKTSDPGGSLDLAGPLVGLPEPRTCTRCHNRIPADGAWCPRCGLQVADPCWQCGRGLPQHSRFCTWCGTPVGEPAVLECGECGAQVGPGHGYCSACGTQVRIVCRSCDRPMRREWRRCPTCGGLPSWAEEGEEGEAGEAPRAAAPSRVVAPPADEELERDREADADHFNQAGIQAYEAEDYEEAVLQFRRATDANPDHARYFTNLGVAYGELGRTDEAIAAYQSALELDPKESEAYLPLAYLFEDGGERGRATELLQELLREAPDSEEAEEAREVLRSWGVPVEEE